MKEAVYNKGSEIQKSGPLLHSLIGFVLSFFLLFYSEEDSLMLSPRSITRRGAIPAKSHKNRYIDGLTAPFTLSCCHNKIIFEVK